ncbi:MULTISPECIES: hypothetical protein [Stenotrophomonas]|uniref:hypothetical protein n=1 Tax=Stenotrophomonas TaxID=40323 RepID=UPI0022EB0F04|nr:MULTISPECIES: hypothetical protein [Stenotrophomonas]MDA3305371.1 hypothetical protein [Stenotrophomonas sp. PI_27]WGS56889.1 hypothetical protein IAI57_18780 [Stenotrophomonas pavanii]
MLGSLKADWKVKINSKSIHAWRGYTGCGFCLRNPRLFALAEPAVLGSLKADWKVKINSKSIHAWRGSTGCCFCL